LATYRLLWHFWERGMWPLFLMQQRIPWLTPNSRILYLAGKRS
jgi:hypothetical protein